MVTQLVDAPGGPRNAPPASSPEAPRHRVRADIQGLRAIAVASVVVYHFWPSLLPGGFTGVDVFFVVSGFLITGQILRDVDRHRPLRFAARFWAARVRRIMPAALLVLGFVLVASWFIVPASQWPEIGRHVLASALSIENWVLAGDAVDYGAEGAAPSPVQHFWSLSVEEQFYLVWPVLLLLATLFARRFGPIGRLGRRGVVGIVMGLVLVASLCFSFIFTNVDPGAAYFVTPTRMWQLAAGGLVALIAVRGIRFAPWVGVALIGVGFFVLNVDMPYPGIAAMIPTVGACLVLLGGPDGRFSFDRAVSARPIQHLGDISYSVYLWHWPLLIIVPIALGHELSILEAFGLLAIILVVSEASYRFIEQPFRRGWLLRTSPRSLALGTVAVLIIVAGAVRFDASGQARIEAAAAEFEQTIASADECFGAAALDNTCGDPFAPVDEAAALAGNNDLPIASRKPRCSDDTGPFSEVICHYGDPNGARTVLLWGNSHASAWSDAIDAAGKRLKWNVIVASRSGCPATLGTPPPNEIRKTSQEEQKGCAERNEWVVSTLAPKVDLVVMSDLRAGYADGARSVDGFVEAITRVREAGATVVWLGDVPLTDGITTRRDGPECLELNGQCSNPVSKALVARSVTDEVAKRVPDLLTIDPTDRFCDDERCYSAVGGVSVYFDGLHLSGTYSRTLGPWLARELKACAQGASSCPAL